ncbi:DUF3859 domain-containing protein [uncultured Tateyamaria sp.]|uniref:DUF3859 domain-containing protein n=1 Tax=uncultured Tateyamaria sp. TaxID=455651 RepID=UPI002629A9D2|nr:DUF3859 domain-containing protein [uncultured Tateyamaria sp.]
MFLRSCVLRALSTGFCVTVAFQALAEVPEFILRPPLTYLSHGIDCTLPDGEIVSGQDTVDGEVIVNTSPGTPILIETLTAPTQVGLSLMIAFSVQPDTPPTTLTASVTHPPMGPQRTTRQTWSLNVVGGDKKAFGYGLEDKFEEVPGLWTFRLADGDRVLLQQTFTMVTPDKAQHVMDTCFPDTLPRS